MALTGSDPKLIIALEARLDRFEKQLREAGLIAERELEKIKTKTSDIALGNLLARGAERAFDAMVESIKKAIAEMQKLSDVAEATGVAIERIQQIGFATRAAGVDDAAMMQGLDAIGAKLNDINHTETELSKLLDANNVKYRERNGQVVNANRGLELAAELMGRAKTEFDKIKIAEKFGLTRDWVKVLGEGVDAFTAMKNAANIDPNLKQSLEALKQIEAIVNRTRAEFTGWGTSLTRYVLPALQTMVDFMHTLAQAVAAMPWREDIGVKQFFDDLERRWKRVKDQADEATKPRLEVTPKPGVRFPQTETGEKDALTRQNEQLAKTIALSRAELETVTLTVAKQEEKRQLALLEEAAKRAGLDVDTAVTEEMRKQAELAGQIRQQVVERQHAWSEMMSASRELGSIMSDAMKSMVLEGQKFDAVLKNIMNRIASRAFDKMFDLIFAAPAGGGSSIFGKILSGVSGGKAGGGPVTGGQAYMVGERGPELFVPGKSGMIVPNTALARGAGGDTIVTGAPTAVTIQGSADRSTVELMRQMFETRDRRFIADVARATHELRRRSAFA